MPESHFNELSDIARQLLAYWQEHPEASDTLEGIHQWWLSGVNNVTLQESQEALLELVSHLLVVSETAATGEVYYRLSPHQIGSISQSRK